VTQLNLAPPFLLEIGCEELPEWALAPALEHLHREFTALVTRERLNSPLYDPPGTLWGTPRRLAIRAAGLYVRQVDREIETLGPRVETAFNRDGKPTRALEGFARAQGAAVNDLVRVVTPKGECVAAKRREEGKELREVLVPELPSMIASIPFRKMMRWGEETFRFGRPIRWIVCLLGGEVIPVEVAGVRSGRTSRGARFDGSPAVEIPDADAYLETLRRASILVNREERRLRITAALNEECSRIGSGIKVEEHTDLLGTLVGMVESPQAAMGAFDPVFLELPAPVLVTAMIHHQRFFPVRTADGSLEPRYAAVLNCRPDPATIERIRRGNQWVLRARLRDAAFFWREDRKRTLEERLPDLERVLFEANLGSYRAKVDRMESLARELARDLHLHDRRVDADAAAEAARLAKSDLTTMMVQEFPELQGVVGALYSREEEKPESVGRAIEQQYLGGGDAASRGRFSTPEGAMLAVVDRLDTLVGFFLLERIPTSSRDPYSLRRAATALVQATLDQLLSYSLESLIQHSAGLYRAQGIVSGKGEALARLPPFLEERLRHSCQEIHGFRYDAVNAALALGFDNLMDAFCRAEALNGIRSLPDFGALTLSYRRIKNILAGQTLSPLEEARLETGEEKALLRALQGVEERAAPLLSRREYAAALKAMSSLRSPLDRFFEQVLVMDSDARVRANRLALLKRTALLLLKVGDFAEMVLEKATEAGSARRGERG